MSEREGKWNEKSALFFLKNQGIVPIDRQFEFERHDNPGLRCWGAIDFLTHYCGYTRKKSFREGAMHP